MSTVSVKLPQELMAFVESQASTGGYRNVSEYLKALITQAQRQEARAQIELELLEGIRDLEAGHCRELKAEDWERMRQRVRRKAQLKS